MIASNLHGQPSLAPRNACGQLLILPQVYLDMVFGDPVEDCPESPTPVTFARSEQDLVEG